MLINQYAGIIIWLPLRQLPTSEMLNIPADRAGPGFEAAGMPHIFGCPSELNLSTVQFLPNCVFN
jgi:hypothetical protein